MLIFTLLVHQVLQGSWALVQTRPTPRNTHNQYESLKEIGPKFLKNMCFVKRHKKGLKTMQANKVKALSARLEGMKTHMKPKEVKVKIPKEKKKKIPKGVSPKLTGLAYSAHPKFGKHACATDLRIKGQCQSLNQGHALDSTRILEWVPLPPPGDLPDPGIEPMSPALTGRFFTTEPPGSLTFSWCLHITQNHL
uniref:60S ribosomal protein L29 n=1 Tax=Bos mutus grunniens TaxID=30521 RepID=A0A8B9W313_BOSMU